MDLEPPPRAESNEIRRPPGPPLSEGKMLSDEQVADPDTILENPEDELIGGEFGKGLVELQEQHFLDPGRLKARQFFIRSRQQ